MRLAIAAASLLITSAAAAEPPPEPAQALASRLAALSANNPEAGSVGWAFVNCVRAQATALAMRPEPKRTDADWRPSARPSLQEEAASLINQCSLEEARLAAEVSAAEMETFRVIIEADAIDTILWSSRKHDRQGVRDLPGRCPLNACCRPW